MVRKFKYLQVPHHWETYWSKYPHGYSILEAIISWVSQVDDMIDNLNKNNQDIKDMQDDIEDFKEHTDQVIEDFKNDVNKTIDDFIESLDPRFQEEARKIMTEWLENGVLEDIINEEVFGEFNNRLSCLEQDFLLLGKTTLHRGAI